MKKKILIGFIIVFTIIITMVIGWDLYVEVDTTYKSFEFLIPLVCKREVTTLQYGDFFDNEKLEKMYLSKGQARRVLYKIENNSNWIKGEIDEKVEERLKFYTREDIYNKIPYVENKYWIFTNRSGLVKDKHSIDEAKTMYYAVSFGVFDIDNSILYYYEYDR